MKKFIVLNYGRPTPDAEPDGESAKRFQIESFRVLFGMIAFIPEGKGHSDETYLPIIDGCLYYDGVWYSDIWVEDESESSIDVEEFDINKAKAPEDSKRKHTVDDVIASLKGMEVDGETTQYILEKIGMDEQMLRQLIMTLPTEYSEELLEEKRGLDGSGLSRQQLVNRLAFIADDAKELGELLDSAKVDMEFCTNNAPIGTILSNIEIASNPNDSEPENEKWIAKKYFELGINEGDDGTRTLKNFDTEEEAVSLKKELEDMFPDMKLFVDTCTYNQIKRG